MANCPIAHPLSDNMNRVAMKHGMVKINQNRSIRNEYHRYLAANSSLTELTRMQEEAVEQYSRGIERFMVEVFGSAGKA